VKFIFLYRRSLVDRRHMHFIPPQCPLIGHSSQQILIIRVFEAERLPAHGTLFAPLRPLQNALQVVLVLAIGHGSRVIVTKGLQADTASIVASILYSSLHKRCRR
jgi:hypothetical protein